jgi:single-strand DNA-binding protein
MNKWCGTGRLTRDVELKYAGETAFAKFSIAVQRDFKRDGEPDADFLNCTVFGKRAETLNQYFSKGMKIEITGRIQTGNYTNKDGVKVYTTDIMVESFSFAESKQNGNSSGQSQQASGTDGFMQVPDTDMEELPFS